MNNDSPLDRRRHAAAPSTWSRALLDAALTAWAVSLFVAPSAPGADSAASEPATADSSPADPAMPAPAPTDAPSAPTDAPAAPEPPAPSPVPPSPGAPLSAPPGSSATSAPERPRGVDLAELEQRAFRAAVDRVAPSVLRIETVGGLERVSGVLFGTGPTSGVVVDPDGLIVSSSFHFVNRPASILVRMPDGQRRPAELVATDHNYKLALLRVKTDEPLPVPEAAPADSPRVGQWAIAVGRTFEPEQPNVSVGILSAVGRIWGKALQTDANVSPNNYGGALIDIRGRVLGIIVPLSPQSAEEVAGVEWYDSGIGFAIGMDHVLRVLPRLKRGEDLYPGVAGLSLGRDLYSGQADVAAVQPGSPAADAGIKPGDRIIELDGRPIRRGAEVKEEISRRYAGDTIHLVVMRKDQRVEADVTLVVKLAPYEFPFLGVLPMRGAAGDGGVRVRYVYPDSPAAAAGLEAGDIITALGGAPVADRDALAALLRERKPGQQVELAYRRGGQSRTTTVTLASLPENLPPAELPPATDANPTDATPTAPNSTGAAKPGDAEQPLGDQKPAAGARPGGDAAPDGDGKKSEGGTAAKGAQQAEATAPARGVVALRVVELKNEAMAYVPEDYTPDVPHGVVLFLHAPGGFEPSALVARWKPVCERSDLILVAPKAEDPQRWQPREAALMPRWLEEVRSKYTIDPSRVVVHGRQEGGALGYVVAVRQRELLRAVAVVDAAPPMPLPANDPLYPLAVYSARCAKAENAAAINRADDQLHERKIPLTIKDLGPDARDLDDTELAELGRWIDMLDRL